MNKQKIQEEKDIRDIQRINDLFCMLLRKRKNLSVIDVILAIQYTRKYTLDRYPQKEELYNMIYRSRFVRIIKEHNLFNKIMN